MKRCIWLFLSALICAPPVFAGSHGQGVVPPTPCDVALAAGTPCVAAHSVTRRLYAGYAGFLFRLQRTSDNTTLDVGTNSTSHVVDLSGIASFCASTVCGYRILYDQSGNSNDLTQPGISAQFPYGTTLIPPTTGSPLPIIVTTGASFQNLDNRASTTRIPKDSSNITEYYVRGSASSSACCGDYGNVENPGVNTGNGHMFQLAFSTFNGTPAQFGIDRENGLLSVAAGSTPAIFNLLAKWDGINATIKMADATSGSYTSLYSGSLGVSPHWEGGLTLGVGGDYSNSVTRFFEGVVISGATTTATDNSIQSDVAAFYGSSH